MATTTAETQRDLMITTVKAITPTKMANHPWTPFDEVTDYREWAEQNPQAAFRRFSIRYSGPVNDPDVHDTVQAWETYTAEFISAYPRDGRYGPKQALDREDILWTDLNQVDDVIGPRGFSTFGDAAVTKIEKTEEEGTAVDFAVLRLSVQFWRATA